MLCAAAVLLASASIAKAQAQIEVTPFAGYYIASDIYNTYSTVNPGTSTVELTNSGLWGVKVAAVGFRGGLEFSYTRTGSDIKINHPLQGQPPRGTIGRLELDSTTSTSLAISRPAIPARCLTASSDSAGR
jgi:hypothetical protein